MGSKRKLGKGTGHAPCPHPPQCRCRDLIAQDLEWWARFALPTLRTSYLAGTALAEIGNGFIGQPVELAAPRAPLDLVVEPGGVERLEPGAEPDEFIGRQLRYGLLDLFDCGHVQAHITVGGVGKGAERAMPTPVLLSQIAEI